MKKYFVGVQSLFIILTLFFSIQVYAKEVDDVFKKMPCVDTEVSKLHQVYSTKDDKEAISSEFSDVEIVTNGGVGTTLKLDLYGEGFELINSYNTVIENEHEYNYIKAEAFKECLSYEIITDDACTVDTVNFYTETLPNNVSGRVDVYPWDEESRIQLLVDHKDIYMLDSEGCYSFYADPTSKHILEFLVDNEVVTTYYDIQPSENGVTTLQQVDINLDEIDKPGGMLYGELLNVATNTALTNATINIRKGLNNRTGDVVKTIASNSKGCFSAELNYGYYTAEIFSLEQEVIKTFFSFIIDSDHRILGTIGITPPLEKNQMRIILQGQNCMEKDYSNDFCEVNKQLCTYVGDYDAHILSESTEVLVLPVWDEDKCNEFLSQYCEDHSLDIGTVWYVPLQQGISYDMGSDIYQDVDSFVIDFTTLPNLNKNNAGEITDMTYDYYVMWYNWLMLWSVLHVDVYKGNELINQYYAPVEIVDEESRTWKVFSIDPYSQNIF